MELSCPARSKVWLLADADLDRVAAGPSGNRKSCSGITQKDGITIEASFISQHNQFYSQAQVFDIFPKNTNLSSIVSGPKRPGTELKAFRCRDRTQDAGEEYYFLVCAVCGSCCMGSTLVFVSLGIEATLAGFILFTLD